jgi:sugar lactone lactonase YvrE
VSRRCGLYVAGGDTQYVSIYDLQGVLTPRIGAISQGIHNPIGVTVDKQGNLYVANTANGAGDVTIYAAGATVPKLTLEGLGTPISTAVDSSGNVYVANRGTAPSIVVYAPGQSEPSQIITSSLIQMPAQVQLDSHENVYFSDDNTGISEVPYGSAQPVSLNLEGLLQPSGLAIDPLSGNLFVGDISARHIPSACTRPGRRSRFVN